MSAHTQGKQEYRLACVGFVDAETDAARRLIALLGKNLKQPWRLVGPGEDADVALANLDADIDPDALRHGTVAYCAHKPAEHRQAALHLPLRSYELLNLLNAEAPAGAGTRNAKTEQIAVSRYRLRAWPLQANDWTRERWRLMAAIRHRSRSANGLAMQTGIDVQHVQSCLDELERLGALERNTAIDRAEAMAMPHALSSGWRELAARVSQLLGFAR